MIRTTSGITNDGSADVTLAIQALIDEIATNAEGGTLIFLPGTYLLNHTQGLLIHGKITLRAMEDGDKIEAKGEGKPIIKRGPSRGQFHRLFSIRDLRELWNGEFREVDMSTAVKIRNLIFDGNLLQQAGYNGEAGHNIEHQAGIFAGNSDHYPSQSLQLEIDDCEFCNLGGDAIQLVSGIDAVIQRTKSERCLRGTLTMTGNKSVVVARDWEAKPHWQKQPNGEYRLTDFVNHELDASKVR
ncbi:MAG: glycosyl hydrolase family 28-related protein, partial [Bacteroidota bacterium]